LTTWFDEDRMEADDIDRQMIKGIDNTKVVLVFITERYISKVGGDNDDDNCLKEFRYAIKRKGKKNMIAIVMEEAYHDQTKWFGLVGMHLNNVLFISFADSNMWGLFKNDKVFESRIDELINKIEVKLKKPTGFFHKSKLKQKFSDHDSQDTSLLPTSASLVISNADSNQSVSKSVFRMNNVDPKLKRTDADIKTAVKEWCENPRTASKKYGHISDWDTSAVTNMKELFCSGRLEDDSNIPENEFNDDISNWDVSNVITMEGMFVKATSFNQPIGVWNTHNVTTMDRMFSGVTSFNQPIGAWDTHNVTTMDRMFAGATSFNQPIGAWNTHNVTNMNGMFYNAALFNQPIGAWNTHNVTTMCCMFSHATSFNQPIGAWDTHNVTDMDRMFLGATSFNQPIGAWDTHNVTWMGQMFQDAISFNQPIGAWDTHNVTGMKYMFYNAALFNQPIAAWDTHNVIYMEGMFFKCPLIQAPHWYKIWYIKKKLSAVCCCCS
jgi:surface protein